MIMAFLRLSSFTVPLMQAGVHSESEHFNIPNLNPEIFTYSFLDQTLPMLLCSTHYLCMQAWGYEVNSLWERKKNWKA